ncbi:[protein-PII] uridylyltransferase [Marinicella rhabdoformis]|uniref:[protein-PII] uridylyltransferase n=1 Tax=Marinicella rhabdoformis TaxID=2580566 RepID=UPI0012AEC156|nr:[protein-PII] uridylyltransferase [Marinicella rhabdoformis]
MALLAPPDHADDYFDVLSLSIMAGANVTTDVSSQAFVLKKVLAAADEKLNEHFYQWQNISRLVHTRAWVVEQFVLFFWRQGLAGYKGLSLVAVGGFGRGEMQPHSDVDLLILFDGELPQSQVAQFIQDLWDLGLDVGHAVRTVAESVTLADNDVTVATNLMEARFMTGCVTLFDDMIRQCSDDIIWSGRDFFQAKYKEQGLRHKKCGDTAYNLEPNIKEGQGGLRDIQMITWVAQRHFHVRTMHGLVDVGFLLPDEYISLQRGQRKLWKIRFALHLLAGRKEDRILFEYQKKLAAIFGYQDDEDSLAVEKFMQSHYRNAMQLELLNMRLLQLFKENILQNDEDKNIIELNEDFVIINHYIEAQKPQLFIKKPAAIMDLFLCYQQHPETAGIRANTLRYLSQSLHVIDDQFRADPEIKDKFLTVFKQKDLVYSQLSLMNALGVLGLYLPVFGKIVGRMQYDLFHMYTVDQHSLFVLRNIRRIIRDSNPHVLAHDVAQSFDAPYVLCLAGFFHDIAKGRGGDHAELGAVEADIFAVEFGLPEHDKSLLVWLVKYHLIMSVVAQKQDISDVAVISNFAELVQDQRHLDALYVLTIADISGTDPKLWNSYKDSLLSELYQRTSQYLDSSGPTDQVAQSKTEALEMLDDDKHKIIQTLWQDIPDKFFDYTSVDQIALISDAIANNNNQETVCITDQHDDGFEVVIYGKDHKGLFHHVVQLLTQYQINIVNARIYSGKQAHVMDSFHCLGEYDDDLLVSLTAQLLEVLKSQNYEVLVPQHRSDRREQHFSVATEISFTRGRSDFESRMEIKCADQQGLLANITACFLLHDIEVHAAKIATFGHQAEDVFWLSHDNKALSKDKASQLMVELNQALSDD